jgi:myo-inositol-1(or 4)-monophosphatase
MSIDNAKIMDIALEAALAAGQYLQENYRRYREPNEQPKDSGLNIEFKGEVDLVTRCDLESQKIICDILQKNFPDHSILAEENLDIVRNKELLWVIDPIDGTTNFAHSLPIFCVSIAFQLKGKSHVGVIYIPLLDEIFYATRGNGAFMNGKRLGVTGERMMGNSLLATGFPYDRHKDLEKYIKPFKRFLGSCRGIRRMGSAAIDLSYVAAGRLDGYWESELNPWDTAAASLLVEEAGGKITDYSGKPFNPSMKQCLASNGLIHKPMIDILQSTI